MGHESLESTIRVLNLLRIIFWIVAPLVALAAGVVSVMHTRRVDELNAIKAAEAARDKAALQGLQDRTLTADQIARLADKLRPFAGTKIDVFTYFVKPDLEPTNLAEGIIKALDSARWVIGTYRGDMPEPVTKGLEVDLKPNADPKPARALLDGLSSTGLKVDGIGDWLPATGGVILGGPDGLAVSGARIDGADMKLVEGATIKLTVGRK